VIEDGNVKMGHGISKVVDLFVLPHASKSGKEGRFGIWVCRGSSWSGDKASKHSALVLNTDTGDFSDAFFEKEVFVDHIGSQYWARLPSWEVRTRRLDEGRGSRLVKSMQWVDLVGCEPALLRLLAVVDESSNANLLLEGMSLVTKGN
jgi:hypothetical protein